MVTPNHYGIIAQASDPVKLPAGLEIRRAGPEDRAVLEQMSDIIARHQALAPAWVATDSTTLGELREGFAELAADPDVTVWLAFQNGEAVGYQAFFEAPPAADDLITPERCGELKVAGTVPSARGIGVGSALTPTRAGTRAHQRARGMPYRLARAQPDLVAVLAEVGFRSGGAAAPAAGGRTGVGERGLGAKNPFGLHRSATGWVRPSGCRTLLTGFV